MTSPKALAPDLLNTQAQAGSQPPKPTIQPPVPGAPGALPGGAAVSPITPQNTLRGNAIMPSTTPRLATAQGQTDAAAAGVHQAQVSPIARYQAAAAPYHAQGNALAGQAAGTAGVQQGYGNQAAQSIANVGIGQYADIAPTINGGNVSAGAIGGPSYTQGNVTLPGVSTGPLSGLRDLAFGQDTNAMRQRTAQGVDSLYTAPDRVDLAKQAFDLFGESQRPLMDQQVRKLGGAASAFGRQGSGLVNSQLADIGTAFATSADQQRRGLALDAADKTMSDRLGRVSATQSGMGQLAGMDSELNASGNRNRLDTFDRNLGRDEMVNRNALSQAGFNAGRDDARNDATFRSQDANASNSLKAAGMNADLARDAFDQRSKNRDFALGVNKDRNSLAFDKANTYRDLGNDAIARGKFQSGLSNDAFGRGDTERDFVGADDDRRNGLAFDKLKTLGGREDQVFDQDQTTRDEVRGERGYQDDLAEQANDSAINQYIQEQADQGQAFDQNNTSINTLGKLGYGQDPTSQLNYEGAGQVNQGSSAVDAFGNVLKDTMATPSYSPVNALDQSYGSPKLKVPPLAPPSIGNLTPRTAPFPQIGR